MKKETAILVILATIGAVVFFAFPGSNRSDETQATKPATEVEIQESSASEPVEQTEPVEMADAPSPAPQTEEPAETLTGSTSIEEIEQSIINPLPTIITPPQEEASSESTELKGIPSEAWSDVGTGDAIASLETFLWTGNSQDLSFAEQMVRWKETESASELSDIDATKRRLVESTTEWIKNLDTFDIMINEQLDDSTRRVVVGFETPDGPEARGITFIKEGEDWFPLMHLSAASESWDHTSFEGAP
jgi:hypothetical protein